MSVIYPADRDTETVEQYFFFIVCVCFFFFYSFSYSFTFPCKCCFFLRFWWTLVWRFRWDCPQVCFRQRTTQVPGEKISETLNLSMMRRRSNLLTRAPKWQARGPRATHTRQRGTGRNTFPLQVFTFGFSSICLKPNFFTSVVLLPAPSPLFLPRLPNTRPLCKLYNQQEGRRKKKKERAKT